MLSTIMNIMRKSYIFPYSLEGLYGAFHKYR